MPVAAGPQAYQGQFPSFMSVYGINSSSMGLRSEVTGADDKLATARLGVSAQSENKTAAQQLNDQQNHRDGNPTQPSESTESSPTTTISTADSSSLTDPSPSSSPQSPVTIVPLSSFSAGNFNISSLDDLTMSDRPTEPKPLSYERPMTSPSPRKARNAKGLALKLTSLAGDPPEQNSMPSSPSFVKPPTMKPRKKPSVLSLQTSANPIPNALGRLAQDPPPTPGVFKNPVLRHAASSPQMLFSPDPRGGGPEGGMQLPFERSRITGLSNTFRKPSALKDLNAFNSGLTIDEEESPIKAQMATRSLHDVSGDDFDRPASQEDAKSPGYPNGPIAIYEPNVYLYLEPTAEEAQQFDVVMNVASEVKNPFQAPLPATGKEKPLPPLPKTSFDEMEIDRDNIPEPSTAMSTATYKTAFEFQPDNSSATPTESSPTTPKPAVKAPEYLHVPWEHNTDISKDLMDLCEIIDSRTQQGKKVLVHCQQGASRSASLIIAYGIFRNPNLTVNEAYLAAQEKSKWISPNMKLMYALQDFHKEMQQKRVLSGSGFKRITGWSPTKHRTTLSADNVDLSLREPLTAPLPLEKEGSGGNTSPGGTPSRARGNSTPSLGDISPGPSSAPSSFKFNLQPLSFTGPGLWQFRRPSTGQPSGTLVESGPSSPKPNLGSEEHYIPPDLSSSQSAGFDSPRRDAAMSRKFRTESLEDHHGLLGSPLPNATFDVATNAPTGVDTSRTEGFLPLFLPVEHRPEVSSFGDMNNAPSHTFVRTGDDISHTQALWSPRVQEMTANPMHSTFNFASYNDAKGDETDFSELMSPRVAEFSDNPFHQSFANAHEAASSFGFSTMTSDTQVPLREDPRSPATKGEAPIIRSIDDFL